MANRLDTILRFLLDKGSAEQTKAGIKDINQEMKNVQQTAGQGVGWGGAAFQQQAADYKKFTEEAARGNQKINEGTKRNTTAVGQFGFGLRELTADYRRLLFATERLQYIGQQTFVAGAAVVGGIFALANKYAKEAGYATEATLAWKEATDDLALAGRRASAVLLEASLPTLERIVNIMEDVAGFLERNPAIASAALNAGILLGGIGLLEIAVAKGIKIVLGAQYLQTVAIDLVSAKLKNTAADKNVAAAAVMNTAADKNVAAAHIDAAKLKGVLGTLLKFGGGIAAVGGIAAGVSGYNALASSRGLPNASTTIQGAMLLSAEGRIRNLQAALEAMGKSGSLADKTARALDGSLRVIEERFRKLGESAGFLEKRAEGTGVLAGSLHEREVVDAFDAYRKAEIEATAQTEAQRLQIIEDAGKQMVAATAKYQEAIAEIHSNATTQRVDAIMASARAEEEAENNNAVERAKIIRDAGIEIQRIEEDLQERLRKMKLEHNDRMADLEGQRDAIGLVLEQRNYERERAEEIRATNIEIARRRQDLAIRLADLDATFRAEQAQRQVHLAEQLAQIAAQEQAKILQAQENYKAEQRSIATQEREKLRDLQAQATRERQVRYNAFIQQIRDLDATLLGERDLRVNRYNLILQDAANFLDAYRATLNLSGVPSGQTGGYTGRGGLVRTHPHEFLLSPSTTLAAERAIGGGLNQQNILGALGGGGQNIRVTQNIRFSGEVSAGDKREVRRIAKEATLEAIYEVSRG